MPTYRRKLIEVDLPLDEINQATVSESTTSSGHPWRIHLWWSRKRLAASRAIIFASIVDDPSSYPDEFPTPESQRAERERLHTLLRRLVVWKNVSDEKLMSEVRYEIARSVARSRHETAPTDPIRVLSYLNDNALPVYDPFAGGGSIPLEAQRLGLRAVASDLNPVAVLINKALIEIPPKFANRPPVNPSADPMGMTTGRFKGRGKSRRPEQVAWRGAAGLAADIRYYGRWMREKAFERVGHLYPIVTLPDGSSATVAAWLWTRTVPCPNPACGIPIPLKTTFQLSTKKGNRHWTRPVVNRKSKTVSFVVQNHNAGVPKGGTVNRNGATCIACSATAPLAYVREQARDGKMDAQMTAIVAEGDRSGRSFKRVFLSPSVDHIKASQLANPDWRPSGKLPDQARSISVQIYGFTNWHQLFTERQLATLTAFSDLVSEAHRLLTGNGIDADYADAICTYLALAVGRSADICSSFTSWDPRENVRNVFTRQGVGMIWDYAEAGPFSNSTRNWLSQVESVASGVANLPASANDGMAHQMDASTTIQAYNGPVVVTDPPYYDNVHYADSSDFFYVWLRPMLRNIYPELFFGILTPKQEEIVANRFRFKDHERRFEDLLKKSLRLIREHCSPEFPSSIFYAYKQQEEERGGRTSTGWDTMLSALVNSGFRIVGTWPVRTELATRSNSMSANSLASSVVLVCRPRPDDAPIATRRQFLNALERDLPTALNQLTRESHIAPVDLAQAAIGPGMEIYSQYSRVETLSGERVTVRDALVQINRVIAEYHRREQGELDLESQFCVAWLRQNGYSEGGYGEAEVLSQAMNVAVDGLSSRRLLTAERGRVALLPLDEYGPDRQPALGEMTAWEGCFRIAYHLNREYGQGIRGAAEIARSMGSSAESVERLARILYEHYDNIGESPNAVIFNSLVTSWQDIQVEAQQLLDERQGALV